MLGFCTLENSSMFTSDRGNRQATQAVRAIFLELAHCTVGLARVLSMLLPLRSGVKCMLLLTIVADQKSTHEYDVRPVYEPFALLPLFEYASHWGQFVEIPCRYLF